MGEVAETIMTKKRKKKGRPSLLDLQKRSLKLQQKQHSHQHQPPPPQNPNSPDNGAAVRRSTRRNPNSYAPEWIGDDDDDDDERQQKKLRLLHGLNSQHQPNIQFPFPPPINLGLHPSNPHNDGDNSEAPSNDRKISNVRPRSDELGEKVAKATDTLHGSLVVPGPTTPLPDKKLLVFILDRLQKKDTYGVFSEPVDPEELPDYHDIVKNPMDFSTLRKRLDGGVYANLEQFEKDVFLIFSNAMLYNSPDTIYFRQARSMQELAKKDFENLRQDSDDEETEPKPEPKVAEVPRRGRPPGKLKKSIERSPVDRVGPSFSSDATLATVGDNSNLSNGYNLRRTTSSKYQPVDSLIRATNGSHSSETYATWLSEWENEFPASVVRAVMKYGKKQFPVDENKRDTYMNPLVSMHEPSIFTTFEGELKQLMAVGLSSEHGYATSLARFAADMGPVVWEIASKKIEAVLPLGFPYGPGWVGENIVVERQQIPFSSKQKQKVSDNSATDDQLSRLQPSNNTGSNSVVVSRSSGRGKEEMMETIVGLNSQPGSSMLNGGLQPMPCSLIQRKPIVHPAMNGVTGGFGYNCPPEMGMPRFGSVTGKSCLEQPAVPSPMLGMVSTSNTTTFSQMPANDCNPTKANLSENSSGLLHPGVVDSYKLLNAGGLVCYAPGLQGLSSAFHQQEFLSSPPDLNDGYMGSPVSTLPIGSPKHPDLALQL